MKLSILKIGFLSFLISLSACTRKSSSDSGNPQQAQPQDQIVSVGPQPTVVIANLSVVGLGRGGILATNTTTGSTLSCSADASSSPFACAINANVGDKLVLNVLADDKEAFSKWTGCTSVVASENGTSCNLTVGNSSVLTAQFVPPVYVSSSNCGNGTVLLNGSCYPSTSMCTLNHGIGIVSGPQLVNGSIAYAGACVAQGCESGYNLVNGQCLSIPSAVTCDSTTTLVNGSCIAKSNLCTVANQPGIQIGSNSACYPLSTSCSISNGSGIKLLNPATSTTSQSVYGTCVYSCDQGYQLVNNSCQPVSPANPCSSGFAWSGQVGAVSTVCSKICPAGQVSLDGVNCSTPAATISCGSDTVLAKIGNVDTCVATTKTCSVSGQGGTQTLTSGAGVSPVYSQCVVPVSVSCGNGSTQNSANICVPNTLSCTVSGTNQLGTQTLIAASPAPSYTSCTAPASVTCAAGSTLTIDNKCAPNVKACTTSSNSAGTQNLTISSPQNETYGTCTALSTSTCSSGQFWNGSQCSNVASLYILPANFIIPVNSSQTFDSTKLDLNSGTKQLTWNRTSSTDGSFISTNGEFFVTAGLSYNVTATTAGGNGGIAVLYNYSSPACLRKDTVLGGTNSDVTINGDRISIISTAVVGEIYECTVSAINPVGIVSTATFKVTVNSPAFTTTMASASLNDKMAYSSTVVPMLETSTQINAPNSFCPVITGTRPTSSSYGFELIPPPGITIPTKETTTSSFYTFAAGAINKINLLADRSTGCLISGSPSNAYTGIGQLDLSNSGFPNGVSTVSTGWKIRYLNSNGVVMTNSTTPEFSITFNRVPDLASNYTITSPTSFMKILPDLFLNQARIEQTTTSGELNPAIAVGLTPVTDAGAANIDIFDPFNSRSTDTIPTAFRYLFGNQSTVAMVYSTATPAAPNFTFNDYIPFDPTVIPGLTTVSAATTAAGQTILPSSEIVSVLGSTLNTPTIVKVQSSSSNKYPISSPSVQSSNCYFSGQCTFSGTGQSSPGLPMVASTYLDANPSNSSQNYVLPGQYSSYLIKPYINTYILADSASSPKITYTLNIPGVQSLDIPFVLNPVSPTGFGSFPDSIYPQRLNQPGGGNSTVYLGNGTSNSFDYSHVSGTINQDGTLKRDLSTRGATYLGPQTITFNQPSSTNQRTFYMTTVNANNSGNYTRLSFYDSNSYVANDRSFKSTRVDLTPPSGYSFSPSGDFAMFNNNGKLLVVAQLVGVSNVGKVAIFNIDPFNLTATSNKQILLNSSGNNVIANVNQGVSVYFDVRDQLVFVSSVDPSGGNQSGKLNIEAYDLASNVAVNFNMGRGNSSIPNSAPRKVIRIASKKYVFGNDSEYTASSSVASPTIFIDLATSSSPQARTISPRVGNVIGSNVGSCYLVTADYTNLNVQAAFVCKYVSTSSNSVTEKLSYWSDSNPGSLGPIFSMLLDIQTQASGNTDLNYDGGAGVTTPFTRTFENNTGVVALASQTGATGNSLYYIRPGTSNGFPYIVKRLDLSSSVVDNMTYPEQRKSFVAGNKLYFTPYYKFGTNPLKVFVIDVSNPSAPKITNLFSQKQSSTVNPKMQSLGVGDSTNPAQIISDANGIIYMGGAILDTSNDSYVYFGPNKTMDGVKNVIDVQGSRALYINSGRYWVFDSSTRSEYQIQDFNSMLITSDVPNVNKHSTGFLIGPGALMLVYPSWLTTNQSQNRIVWSDLSGISSK